MSISNRELDQILVVSVMGSSKWMTPAQAKRFCDANPLWLILDETHKDWNFFSEQAGPKPVILRSEAPKPGVKK